VADEAPLPRRPLGAIFPQHLDPPYDSRMPMVTRMATITTAKWITGFAPYTRDEMQGVFDLWSGRYPAPFFLY